MRIIALFDETTRKKLFSGFSFDTCEKDLKDKHGSFAGVRVTDTEVLLLTDSISSVPLFYCVDRLPVNEGGGNLLIADDASKIARYKHYGMDEDLKTRFVKSGYAGGENTLFAEVHTLTPSQCIRIGSETGKIEKQRYFNLDYTFPEKTKPEETLLQELDAVMLKVFRDLVGRIGHRPVIVPLSGGCDSRIVVTMLRRLGIENVICVSYGRKGSSELQISRQIADGLGYQWLHTEYDGRKWNSFFQSDDYMEFLKFSTKGGYGIGCVQALPAFLDLKNHGLLPGEAVVIPGHTLDVAAGSHLPYMDADAKVDSSKLRNFIRTSHYGLYAGLPVNLNEAVPLSNEVTNRLAFMNEYMKWEYDNRQSKFIANDVRVYEYCGFSYELPFWDRRLCSFLMKLPYDQLYGRQLQYRYMMEIIDPYIGFKQNYPLNRLKGGVVPGISGKDRLKRWLKPVMKPVRAVKKFYGRLKGHYTNVDAFYDWLSTGEFLQLLMEFGMDFSLNSIVVRDYINGRLWEHEDR